MNCLRALLLSSPLLATNFWTADVKSVSWPVDTSLDEQVLARASGYRKKAAPCRLT